jgi:thiol-disulfide isomerase/thioredoxin
MVDWDRVEELRSKGWDWDKIADDPKVGFHPDTSVQETGRALRGLYHRQRSRQRRQSEAPEAAAPSKEEREKVERKWTLPRIGYLLVPIFAIWFVIAYIIPSPVGLILPAIPYLALVLVLVAFLLLFGLFRSTKARWSKVYRTTLVTGIVLGLVVSGVIALGGILFFGCPVLPSASSATTQPGQGWTSVSVSPWHQNGLPVVYYYGATWCPYCSASSWVIWKALSGFGTVSGTSLMYSAEDSIQEIVLANAQYSSSYITFIVNEDTSGVSGNFPSTSNCVEQAYVGAYSGSSIPFVAVNGQYIHGGSSLISPPNQFGSDTPNQVLSQVQSESGNAWTIVQGQTWWMMAFMAKSAGATTGNLAQQPYYSGWSTATQNAVGHDLSQIR